MKEKKYKKTINEEAKAKMKIPRWKG